MVLKDSFVACFDYLGFKELRKSRGTDGLHRLYTRSLLPMIEHAAALASRNEVRNGQPLVVPHRTEVSLAHTAISDTVLLSPDGDEFPDFVRVLVASHRLLCSGFSGTKAPLRGAIGYGDLAREDAGVWLGEALEDAYLAESSQVWAGCRFSEACRDFCERKGFFERFLRESKMNAAFDCARASTYLRMTKWLADYEIPVYENPKSGPAQYSTARGKVLNWTANVGSLDAEAARRSFIPSSDDHSRRIQENTVAFEKWARGGPAASPPLSGSEPYRTT